MTPTDKAEFIADADAMIKALKEFAERRKDFLDHHSKHMIAVAARGIEDEIKTAKGVKF